MEVIGRPVRLSGLAAGSVAGALAPLPARDPTNFSLFLSPALGVKVMIVLVGEFQEKVPETLLLAQLPLITSPAAVPPGLLNRQNAAAVVDGSMASLNVTLMADPVSALLDACAGLVADTVGTPASLATAVKLAL